MTTPAYIPQILGGVAMAGWDPSDNRWHALNLQILRELQVLMELEHILGLIDARDIITATIASGAAVGATATDTVEVPTGEVWFIHLIEVISPAESGVGVGDIVQVNYRVSIWPDSVSTHGQLYWAANQGTVALNTLWTEFNTLAPVWALKGIPTILRLPAGAKIRLEAILTGAAAGAALSATLTPYGYKGRQLITTF